MYLKDKEAARSKQHFYVAQNHTRDGRSKARGKYACNFSFRMNYVNRLSSIRY